MAITKQSNTTLWKSFLKTIGSTRSSILRMSRANISTELKSNATKKQNFSSLTLHSPKFSIRKTKDEEIFLRYLKCCPKRSVELVTSHSVKEAQRLIWEWLLAIARVISAKLWREKSESQQIGRVHEQVEKEGKLCLWLKFSLTFFSTGSWWSLIRRKECRFSALNS